MPIVQETRDRLIAFYSEGLDIGDIATKMGRSDAAIRQMLIRMKLPHRNGDRGIVSPVAGRPANEPIRARIKELWLSGMAQTAIARELKVSSGTIAGMVTRLGLRENSPRPKFPAARRGTAASPPRPPRPNQKKASRAGLKGAVGPSPVKGPPASLTGLITPFADLAVSACHFPLFCKEECFPGGIYCGAPATKNYGYCGFHGELMRRKG